MFASFKRGRASRVAYASSTCHCFLSIKYSSTRIKKLYVSNDNLAAQLTQFPIFKYISAIVLIVFLCRDLSWICQLFPWYFIWKGFRIIWSMLRCRGRMRRRLCFFFLNYSCIWPKATNEQDHFRNKCQASVVDPWTRIITDWLDYGI